MDKTQKTRDRIVRTAANLFHQQGYLGVGLQALCREADVSKSSFYHFFPSKEAVAMAVIEYQLEQMQPALREVAAGQLPPLWKVRASFQQVYQAAAQMQQEQGRILGCPFGSLGNELAASSPQVRARIAQVLDGLAAFYQGLLDEAVTEEQLPTGTNTAALAGELVTLIQGLSTTGRIHNDPERLRQTGEAMLEALLRTEIHRRR